MDQSKHASSEVYSTNKPCSLPNATSDPVNVTPPMYVPRNRAVLTTFAAGSVAKCGCSNMKLATQVMTAAAPTRLWNRATICGKSVTSIRLAITTPISAPGHVHQHQHQAIRLTRNTLDCYQSNHSTCIFLLHTHQTGQT